MTVGNGLPSRSSFRSIVLRVKYKKHFSDTTTKNNYALMSLTYLSDFQRDIGCHNYEYIRHGFTYDNLYV